MDEKIHNLNNVMDLKIVNPLRQYIDIINENQQVDESDLEENTDVAVKLWENIKSHMHHVLHNGIPLTSYTQYVFDALDSTKTNFTMILRFDYKDYQMPKIKLTLDRLTENFPSLTLLCQAAALYYKAFEEPNTEENEKRWDEILLEARGQPFEDQINYIKDMGYPFRDVEKFLDKCTNIYKEVLDRQGLIDLKYSGKRFK